MKVRWAWLLLAAVAASCGGSGGGGGGGSFRLIQFMEQGQDGIPRNRVLTFLFSAPVADGQDFFERLKIENVAQNPGSNFSLAVGTYEPTGDRVTFAPRLPNQEDRGDAGLRENGNYTVFLKAGPDALRSVEGDRIANPQEMLFDTSEFFEDPFPADPPRVKGLFARDATKLPTEPRTDLSRLDPRPGELALLDNATLIGAARYIEPGAGGAPQFGTPWRLELELTEPVDPSTVTTDSIQLLEIYSDATTSGDTSPPFAPGDWFGTTVNYKVPINVTVEQQVLETGEYDVKIVVEPLVTLVDDTRYRLFFGGQILGIDFRQQFIGVNGITGDGETVISGSGIYDEPGGLGYTAEFIVRDRPPITAKRTLTYDPLADGVVAELGQTTNDPDRLNTALYNPAANPSTAVGYLAAFGNGTDGNLAVSGSIVTIDTGDTPNAPVGKPFSVFDVNPTDNYNANTLPGGLRTYDSRQPFELNLQTLTVSSGATLRFIGVNPVLLRVTGIAQVGGIIDLAGANGVDGKNGNVLGGVAGPGGGGGGRSNRGPSCNTTSVGSNCSSSSFAAYLSAGCGAGWPWSLNGDGPGRGQAGGSAASYMYYYPSNYAPQPGTGGGGGSRATSGAAGADWVSDGDTPGSAGSCASSSYYWGQNSSVVGVRGRPGSVHGDAELFDVTWGGSGGGAGGSTTEYSTLGAVASGGGGGGGGGMFTLACAGAIECQGGTIDVSGGAGGKGGYGQYQWYGTYGYFKMGGGGGGGSGGGICLISGATINASNAVFDATGGAAGLAATNPNSGAPQIGNAGGAGGKGFIYLMDADGTVPGLLPGTAGTYPSYTNGYLKIAPLADGAARFGDIRAVTELFNIPAANPAYLEFGAASDILATVHNGTQQILIYASTAKADTDDPLVPNTGSEIPDVLVARVHFALGATQIDTSYDAMDQLNPTGPNRDAYIRINAFFDYGEIVQAALGPFASMDRMDISYSFNG